MHVQRQVFKGCPGVLVYSYETEETIAKITENEEVNEIIFGCLFLES